MPIPTADEKLAMIRLAQPGEDELRAVATLAPGDYEVGFQRTNDILDEALEVFQRSSRSSMGVAGDVMVAIFSATGDLVNAAAGTYLHAIIQPIIIKYILEHYSANPGVRDGDIWFANDALYGGIHNPDQVVIVPVFHEGRLIAWAGAANHTTETGAVEPGGMPVSATSRFHEGLNLPPVKIGENHVLREDMVEVFNAFGIRAPQMIVTDLKARCTAADRVRTRLLEVADKDGQDFVVGVLRRMLEVAEDGARKRISSWLDGRYRCVTFADALGTEHGLVRNASLTLIKEGDEVTLDFTGTSPENLSPYQAHVQAVVGHVANYVYSYVFYDLPISSATFAPFEFVIPKGTVLNPDDRAATSCSVMVCTGVMSACANVFAKMMFASQEHDRVAASASNAGNAMVIAGQSQWGLPFADMVAYSINTEGMGGRPDRAGMNAFGFPWCPFGRAPDVELMENEFPLLIPLSQHWMDSAGPGKHRGGVGAVQLWMAHQSPQVLLMAIADNSKLQTPQPLFGGYGPCTVPGIGIRSPRLLEKLAAGDPIDLDFRSVIEGRTIDGQWEVEFMGRSIRPYDEGDVMAFGFSAGGAGYGDPLEADPHQVARDFTDGLISAWTMREIYKVAFDERQQEALPAETERLRQDEREARRARDSDWATFLAEWEQLSPPAELLTWFGSWPDGIAAQPVMRM
ncbi:hydantoinase B/oxoprolinase family protein [Capillimicrobium parvum]|uniref:Acetophenone carboxylase delta subunit n=1 Tax=Capillimicrobium parvum TaxID=2884022 RepID=A0A9E7BZB0_9ACTN|nr:hydantoinase B/oxoprolinase family protein [Capillimicrobium parvum]UGS34379.1 Acetophenone carboxylase delta subunit [Capillimicrobium parvum]